MKKTIISTGAFLIVLSALSLQSCNSEKKEETKTDTIVSTTDSTVIDSTAASKKITDTTDTGGRAGQAPPAVKK